MEAFAFEAALSMVFTGVCRFEFVIKIPDVLCAFVILCGILEEDFTQRTR